MVSRLQFQVRELGQQLLVTDLKLAVQRHEIFRLNFIQNRRILRRIETLLHVRFAFVDSTSVLSIFEVLETAQNLVGLGGLRQKFAACAKFVDGGFVLVLSVLGGPRRVCESSAVGGGVKSSAGRTTNASACP